MLEPIKRVFVVDEEPAIARTLCTILNDHGFDAQYFTNPLEALQAARNGCPDLLISGLLLPHLTGVALAIQLKSICSGCQILLMSSQAETDDLSGFAREQGFEFRLLPKPVPPPYLLEIIRRSFPAAA